MSRYDPRTLPGTEALIGGGRPRRGRAAGGPLAKGKSVRIPHATSSDRRILAADHEPVEPLSMDGPDITLELWQRWVSFPASNSDLITNWGASVNRNYAFSITTGGIMQLYFRSATDGAERTLQLDSGPNFVIDTWYHLAVVKDSVAGNFRFYRDGVESELVSAAATHLLAHSTASKFWLGHRNQPWGSTNDGYMSEVRVWSVARSAAEIAEHYQKTLAGNEAGLQGYWRFADDFEDSTVNATTLVPIEAGPVVEDIHPF